MTVKTSPVGAQSPQAPSTTAPPTTAPSATTTTGIAPPATTVPTITGTGITGTVTGPDGQPVAGAYVIGVNSLSEVRTNANGQFTMACSPAPQPLLAASWLISLAAVNGAKAGTFNPATSQRPPSTPGPGYVFSGGRATLAGATTPACGSTVDFALPAGASVTIDWHGPMPSPAPVDNLYLPGLGPAAVLETQPLDASNQQVIDQIGPGMLQIDEAGASFSCSGPGVSGAHPYWYVQVAAGHAMTLDCTTLPAGGTGGGTTPPTTAASTAITGTVTGPDGQPVSGAYVIRVDKLAVARTDAKGR